MNQKELNKDLESKLEGNKNDIKRYFKGTINNEWYRRRSFGDILKHYQNIDKKITDKMIMKALISNDIRCYYCFGTGLIVFFKWNKEFVPSYKNFMSQNDYKDCLENKYKETEYLLNLYDSVV